MYEKDRKKKPLTSSENEIAIRDRCIEEIETLLTPDRAAIYNIFGKVVGSNAI